MGNLSCCFFQGGRDFVSLREGPVWSGDAGKLASGRVTSPRQDGVKVRVVLAYW